MDFVKLLPQFMRKDKANIALSEGVNAVIQPLADKIELLSTWDHIDDLDHAELDELAYELNIHWYDKDASLETKRILIKESDIVYARLGTAWAVEQVVKAYLGNTTAEEWFEYGGDPYYFRLIIEDFKVTSDDIEHLLKLLERVKRKSAWLEGIIFKIKEVVPYYVGVIIRDFYIEEIFFENSTDIRVRTQLHSGALLHESITDTYIIKEG